MFDNDFELEAERLIAKELPRRSGGLDTVAPSWVRFDPADPTLSARPPLQPGRIAAPDAWLQDMLPGGLELVSVMRGDVDGSALRTPYGVYDI